MQFRITRHDGPGERPIFRMFHKFCDATIINHVETNLAERAPLALLLPQNVVVCLMLKSVGLKQLPKMLA